MMYRIPERIMDDVEKRLNIIKKKCEKYNCSFTFSVLKEDYVEDGNFVTKYYVVDVEGIAVINGWEFIAKIEATEGERNIVTGKSERIPEHFYTDSIRCEHCNTNHYRNKSYILYNKDKDKYVQVGTSCLKEYTGNNDAERIVNAMIKAYETLNSIKIEDDLIRGLSDSQYYKLDVVLDVATEVISKYGYVKTTEPENTLSKTIKYYRLVSGKDDSLTMSEIEDFYSNYKLGKNKEFVKNAIYWIKNKEIKSNSSSFGYFNNLKAICTSEYVKFNHIGIVISLIQAYRKELEFIEKQSKNVQSEHVGNIGDRITINIKDFKTLTGYYTNYGYTYIYGFKDDTGNIYTWKTQKSLSDIKSITGTVKAHNIYNNCKQTELTRCKC